MLLSVFFPEERTRDAGRETISSAPGEGSRSVCCLPPTAAEEFVQETAAEVNLYLGQIW